MKTLRQSQWSCSGHQLFADQDYQLGPVTEYYRMCDSENTCVCIGLSSSHAIWVPVCPWDNPVAQTPNKKAASD